MAERRSRPDARRQVASLSPLIGAWAVAAAVLTMVAMQSAVPVEQLFLDAAYLNGAPWYTGVLSSFGVLAWTTGVVAALGGGWVAGQTGRPSAARFLRAAALVTAVLLLDDMLQLHADLLRFTGLPKGLRALLVTVPAGVWMVRYVQEIRRTRWVFLVAALGGFVASLSIDQMAGRQPTDASVFLEDSAKLLGVLAWAQYLVLTTVDIARSTIRVAMAPASGGAADQFDSEASDASAGDAASAGDVVSTGSAAAGDSSQARSAGR